MEEKGLTELPELDLKDFGEWLDEKAQKYFKQKYGEEPEDVAELQNIKDRYCKDTEC